MDVVNAISAQNLILPSGTSKIGQFEYDVDLNGSPQTVPELNDLPIKTVGSTTIYIRDVAYVRDGFPPQTNIVRVDGQRATLLTIQKTGKCLDPGHHFRSQGVAASNSRLRSRPNCRSSRWPTSRFSCAPPSTGW